MREHRGMRGRIARGAWLLLSADIGWPGGYAVEDAQRVSLP